MESQQSILIFILFFGLLRICQMILQNSRVLHFNQYHYINRRFSFRQREYKHNILFHSSVFRICGIHNIFFHCKYTYYTEILCIYSHQLLFSLTLLLHTYIYFTTFTLQFSNVISVCVCFFFGCCFVMLM